MVLNDKDFEMIIDRFDNLGKMLEKDNHIMSSIDRTLNELLDELRSRD